MTNFFLEGSRSDDGDDLTSVVALGLDMKKVFFEPFYFKRRRIR